MRVNSANTGSTFHVLSHSINTSDIRTQQYMGTDFLVVPIVALVEGVIQGAAAANPELALASEFGKMVQGWNGRPVTMNHPKDGDNFISASATPGTFEKEAIGYLFNSHVEDNKLKTEAWIDLSKVARASQSTQDEIKRVQNKEMIEVSTGLFCTVDNKAGKYNNKEYAGTWREIVPDHLALLPNGTKGACSIEDGCGAPRLNKEIKTNCGCDDNKDVKDDNYVKGFKARLLAFFANEEASESVSEDGTNPLETTIETRPNNKENDMTKAEKIAALIANEASGFEEADKVWLETQSDAKLDTLTANAAPADDGDEDDAPPPAVKGKKKANKKPAVDTTVEAHTGEDTEMAACTAEEYIAQAPAAVQEVLTEALKAQSDKRAELVKQILANKQNEFTKEELAVMSAKHLGSLAKLANNQVSFAGRAPGALSTNSTDENSVPVAPVAFPVNKKKEG